MTEKTCIPETDKIMQLASETNDIGKGMMLVSCRLIASERPLQKPQTGQIIALPTATEQPVVQTRRRGRYPKNVFCLYHERALRNGDALIARDLSHEITYWEAQTRLCVRNAEYARGKLAIHESTRRA